jgi:hypothetical protein
MALVTFRNECGFPVVLHARVGAVGSDPDGRGASNFTVHTDRPEELQVGDGDVWYCYGRQQVRDHENPELCRAVGGATVVLTRDRPCFVNN